MKKSAEKCRFLLNKGGESVKFHFISIYYKFNLFLKINQTNKCS